MNTPQSMALGWGSLIVAAGVSYYYAKKGIDERRKLQEVAGTRPMEKLDWRSRIEKQGDVTSTPSTAGVHAAGGDHATSTSPTSPIKSGTV